ncbi:lipoprotein 17-related variable surface protein [Mycoplasma crocodyli]|uniref:Putative lipoprotein n=1 Tax=Mycoplasma crocodyli (strain ATCC 51981 / MP145) TaxID=512564 RepID=D5E4P3_MYCCM|nr:lipoprotein 17-related variable surface protein [Mycoplasma crocodyli]ADE19562.1 putative lipoprotein [Mycoplasma crocodyli MP145]
MKKKILLAGLTALSVIPFSIIAISCNNQNEKDKNEVNKTETPETPETPTPSQPVTPPVKPVDPVVKPKESMPWTVLSPAKVTPKVTEVFDVNKVEVILNSLDLLPSQMTTDGMTKLDPKYFVVNNLSKDVTYTTNLLDFNDDKGEISLELVFMRDNVQTTRKTYSLKANKMPSVFDVYLYNKETLNKLPESFKIDTNTKLEDLRKYANIVFSVNGNAIASEKTLERYTVKFITSKKEANNTISIGYKVVKPPFYTLKSKEGEGSPVESVNVKTITLTTENEINSVASGIKVNDADVHNNVTASHLYWTHKHDSGRNTLSSRFVNNGLITIPTVNSNKVYSPVIVAVTADDKKGELSVQYHLKDSESPYSEPETSEVKTITIPNFKKVSVEFSNDHDGIKDKFHIHYGTRDELAKRFSNIQGFKAWYDDNTKVGKLENYNGGYKPQNLFKVWYNKVNGDITTDNRDISLSEENAPFFEVLEISKEKAKQDNGTENIKVSIKLKVSMQLYGFDQSDFETTIWFWK